MRYLAAFLVIISTLSVVLSSALTTTIEAAERSCFYANVDKKVSLFEDIYQSITINIGREDWFLLCSTIRWKF